MPPTPKSLTAQNHHQTDPLTDSLSYMRTNSFLCETQKLQIVASIKREFEIELI
jgi:hypothetical protein